jgi:hypothetical protein
VPVDTAVYFQALDKDYMEIRRMRSHVTFQPGEKRGCMGCHETTAKTPHLTWTSSLALGRKPSNPEPPHYGSHRLLGYEWMIQPILDKHCVRCHGTEDPNGGLDFTSDRVDAFCQSFRTMFGVDRNVPLANLTTSDFRKMEKNQYPKQLVSVSERHDGAAVTKPVQFGSHQSRLIQVLRDDELHQKEVAFTQQEWVDLVTWIDANAPYHDRFFNRRPHDGSQPRRDIELKNPTSVAAATP